jgi:hypothetical protein
MSVRYFARKCFVILLGPSLFFSFLCGLVQGENSDNVHWQTLETKYTIIHYQSVKDLKKFNDHIDYGPQRWSLTRLFSAPQSDDLTHSIKKKVDALYARVQEILDMRKRMKKVTIKVYHNKEQLHDAYSRLYKTPCRIRAWYVYKQNTICLSVDDLHERMLAHELAHAIIDHYLVMRPPKTTAEILARYVDRQLYE